jgi:hypothetical protein
MKLYIANNKKDNIRFHQYIKACHINNLASAKSSDLKSIFLLACDDFFAHRISIATFAVICSVLYLPSCEIKESVLGDVLVFAQELDYYYHNDEACFFSSLTKIMKFYLAKKIPKS